jgi:diphosphomevalonate decarboxylase
MMKATALAHPMQALVKYHGLKDWNLRLPYHDSISVNLASLKTTTTVEFGDFAEDSITIDDIDRKGDILTRTMSIVDTIRERANLEDRVRVTSRNNLPFGEVKGLGFSASGGAALAAAAFKASGLEATNGWDLKLISRIARRLAGSACRSVTGEYSRWYAGNGDESSASQRFAGASDLDLAMIIVPFGANFSTEQAHKEVENSAFFNARIEMARKRVNVMEDAITSGMLERVGELAELDSLELHALTMTGPNRMVLFRPESIVVMDLVRKLRAERRLPVYFSMQTGPSVFINTYPEHVDEVLSELKSLQLTAIRSTIGEGVKIVG